MFETGTLWNTICAVTAQALRSGDLQPIATRRQYVEDGGVRFLVRIVDNLARKRNVGRSGPRREAGRRNPFLPYDPQLYVGDATETHVCLLNKFNVVDHHLLLVTRHFEHQDQALTLHDFRALGRCMAEYEGLGFYNGGTVAGASQRHKHLQIVPLPLAPEGPRIPIEPLLAGGAAAAVSMRPVTRPFPYAVKHFEPPAASDLDQTALRMLAAYCDLLDATGLSCSAAGGAPIDHPYNLLVTDQWMMLVPRTRETFESIALNALAFAGALLVRNQQEMDLLQARGPMQALRHVTLP